MRGPGDKGLAASPLAHGLKLILVALCFLCPRLSLSEKAWAASRPSSGYTLSLQVKAMTSNAGGQDSYALRWAQDERWEIAAFSNQYLLTGRLPLSGLSYHWRFVVCPRRCFLHSFVQLGVGLSTAGPLLALEWSLTAFWLLRLDLATHIYFAQVRPIIWSYPLWLGLSLPF